MLKFFPELLGDVRNDGQYYPIRALVQPDAPEVRELAAVLQRDHDFVGASHQFVHAFTYYEQEIGDIWRMPVESLAERFIDCDDSAILLCSLLRNYIPAERVFVGVGNWRHGKKVDGHAWVVMDDGKGGDRILESTADSEAPIIGKYEICALFNDTYAFATGSGLVDFGLRPASQGKAIKIEPDEVFA